VFRRELNGLRFDRAERGVVMPAAKKSEGGCLVHAGELERRPSLHVVQVWPIDTVDMTLSGDLVELAMILQRVSSYDSMSAASGGAGVKAALPRMDLVQLPINLMRLERDHGVTVTMTVFKLLR
jgi:hypothetical protein